MISFLDRHPGWCVFGAIVVIVAAIFALPIVLYVVFWDAIFVALVLGINMIAPDSTIIMAFFLGLGVLFRPIALVCMSIYIVVRRIVQVIHHFFFISNAIAILFFTFAGFQQYGETSHSIFAFFGSDDGFALWIKEFIGGCLVVGIPLSIVAIWAINNDMNKDDAPCAPPVRAVAPLPTPKLVASPAPIPTPAQAPSAPTSAGFDRAAWYAQLARENAQQTRR